MSSSGVRMPLTTRLLSRRLSRLKLRYAASSVPGTSGMAATPQLTRRNSITSGFRKHSKCGALGWQPDKHAIKRPGRIDRKYLVMPPDWGRRETIICRVLSAYSKDVHEIDPEVIRKAASSKTLLAKTARMSFPEISAVLYDILALVRGGGDLISKIESYSYPEPVAELIPYLGRVGSSQLLQEELDALLDVVREAVDKSESKFDL